MNFDKIRDGLFVGQKIDSAEVNDALLSSGVTHVLNLYSEDSWQGPTELVKMDDDGSPRTKEQVQKCIRYAAYVKEQGGVLYIHCERGLGRAPAIAYAILRSQGTSVAEAIRIVNQRTRARDFKESATDKPYWQRYIPSIEVAL